MGREVYSKELMKISIPGVATDQSDNQWKVVDAAGVLSATATGDGGLGILQNKPEAGETAIVGVVGVTKAIAGDTITAGALLTNEQTTGHVIAATSTDRIIGIALSDGADTEYITMFVLPGNGINAPS